MKTIPAFSGMFAPVVFLCALILFGLLAPDYSHLTNAVSELGMSRMPYSTLFNIIGFILPGILIVHFTVGFYIHAKSQAGFLLIAWLIGISGLGFALLGIFPAANDFASSTATALHFVMVALNYLPFLALTFLYPFLIRDLYWSRLKIATLLSGVLAVSSFFIPPAILPVGLSQRLGLGIYFAWLFLMGVWLKNNRISKSDLTL